MKTSSTRVMDATQAAIAPIIGYRLQVALNSQDGLTSLNQKEISTESLFFDKLLHYNNQSDTPFFNCKVLIKDSEYQQTTEEVLIQAHSIGDAFCEVFESYQDQEDFFILSITKSEIVRIMSTTTLLSE